MASGPAWKWSTGATEMEKINRKGNCYAKPVYSEVGRWFGLHEIKTGASEGLKQITNLIRLIHKINSSFIILTKSDCNF